MLRIALGADHGGFSLKEEVGRYLNAEGYRILDFGTHSVDSCDYPLFAYKVAKAVSDRKADLGILICRSGNGMAIVANKLPGVRAAMCYDRNVAVLSRQHNDANILVLGSEHLFDEPETIIRAWLSATFEGGRHQRRIVQIRRFEQTICKPARAVKRPAKPKARRK